MKCNHCGKENDSSNDFCIFCGTKIVSQSHIPEFIKKYGTVTIVAVFFVVIMSAAIIGLGINKNLNSKVQESETTQAITTQDPPAAENASPPSDEAANKPVQISQKTLDPHQFLFFPIDEVKGLKEINQTNFQSLELIAVLNGIGQPYDLFFDQENNQLLVIGEGGINFYDLDTFSIKRSLMIRTHLSQIIYSSKNQKWFMLFSDEKVGIYDKDFQLETLIDRSFRSKYDSLMDIEKIGFDSEEENIILFYKYCLAEVIRINNIDQVEYIEGSKFYTEWGDQSSESSEILSPDLQKCLFVFSGTMRSGFNVKTLTWSYIGSEEKVLIGSAMSSSSTYFHHSFTPDSKYLVTFRQANDRSVISAIEFTRLDPGSLGPDFTMPFEYAHPSVNIDFSNHSTHMIWSFSTLNDLGFLLVDITAQTSQEIFIPVESLKLDSPPSNLYPPKVRYDHTNNLIAFLFENNVYLISAASPAQVIRLDNPMLGSIKNSYLSPTDDLLIMTMNDDKTPPLLFDLKNFKTIKSLDPELNGGTIHYANSSRIFQIQNKTINTWDINLNQKLSSIETNAIGIVKEFSPENKYFLYTNPELTDRYIISLETGKVIDHKTGNFLNVHYVFLDEKVIAEMDSSMMLDSSIYDEDSLDSLLYPMTVNILGFPELEINQSYSIEAPLPYIFYTDFPNFSTNRKFLIFENKNLTEQKMQIFEIRSGEIIKEFPIKTELSEIFVASKLFPSNDMVIYKTLDFGNEENLNTYIQYANDTFLLDQGNNFLIGIDPDQKYILMRDGDVINMYGIH